MACSRPEFALLPSVLLGAHYQRRDYHLNQNVNVHFQVAFE